MIPHPRLNACSATKKETFEFFQFFFFQVFVNCDQFLLLGTFRQLIGRLDLKEQTECGSVVELLKVAYNLTMDIEGVRLQAHQALSSIKTREFLNTPASAGLDAKSELVFRELTEALRGLMCPKTVLDEVNIGFGNFCFNTHRMIIKVNRVSTIKLHTLNVNKIGWL